MATAILQVGKLAPKQLVALRRRAKRDGMTPEEYVKQLIENDLESDQKARTLSFAEICKPFHEAFKGVPEAELDAMVDAARTRRHERRNKRRR